MANKLGGKWGNAPNMSGEGKTWVGVDALLDDLQRLLNDRDSGDVVFVVGKEEVSIYAHRLILVARCSLFQRRKRELWSKPFSSSYPYTVRKPQFRPDVFQEVLTFLYSGKVEFKSSTAFEMLRIAEDLEILDLQTACEEHFLDSLSVESAAEFLTDAMSLSGGGTDNTDSHGARALVDKCIAFMEDNAEDIVKTEGFFHLPKPALIKLISSDKFAVSEEELWRAVLVWAKRGSGIHKPTSQWTDGERQRIIQELSGVIDHIKLLLIDSTVYAEEVEPTGVVPMEVSLERYRFAALPNRFGKSPTQDPRLKPRTQHKLFSCTSLLMKDRLKFQSLLNSWYGDETEEWQLLYKASKDSFSAAAFHRKCDGHAPTFTLVQATNGNLCGGFSDQPWRSDIPNGKYIPSNRSFLFTLVNSEGVSPTKFDVVHSKYATLHHPKYGPIFGAGADLCISDNCNEGVESYSNLPHSYASAQASTTLLMGSYNFTVADYEVFGLRKVRAFENV